MGNKLEFTIKKCEDIICGNNKRFEEMSQEYVEVDVYDGWCDIDMILKDKNTGKFYTVRYTECGNTRPFEEYEPVLLEVIAVKEQVIKYELLEVQDEG